MFKSNAGFTLVELIVVIAILGILAVVAVPSYTKYIDAAETAKTRYNNAMESREAEIELADDDLQKLNLLPNG